MLDHPLFDITVVMTTCDRHELFHKCLQAVDQRFGLSIKTQVIVVDESDEKVPNDWLDRVDIVLHRDKRGHWGSFAKDDGLAIAEGEFVCFWDDDNVYYPNAIETLYTAADRHDVGVVQVKRSNDGVILPEVWDGEFVNKHVDTMCLCVRTEIAKRYKWADESDARNTDFRWISRVCKDTNDINFLGREIGLLVPWSAHEATRTD